MAAEQSDRPFAPYAWSTLLTAVAAVVRVGLTPLLGTHYPLGTFYAAGALVGWFLGVGPADPPGLFRALSGSFFVFFAVIVSLSGSQVEPFLLHGISSPLHIP